MTLPASGAISFSNINTELCRSSTAQLSLNDSCLRTLFGQASGAVCMNTGHGKTNTSVPGIPTGVSASATSSSAISVSFSAPGCTGHLAIDYYQVVCTSSGSNSATGASSPISITGLSATTSYTFKVRAHNSKGYGCYSSSTGTATTQAVTGQAVYTTSGCYTFTPPAGVSKISSLLISPSSYTYNASIFPACYSWFCVGCYADAGLAGDTVYVNNKSVNTFYQGCTLLTNTNTSFGIKIRGSSGCYTAISKSFNSPPGANGVTSRNLIYSNGNNGSGGQHWIGSYATYKNDVSESFVAQGGYKRGSDNYSLNGKSLGGGGATGAGHGKVSGCASQATVYQTCNTSGPSVGGGPGAAGNSGACTRGFSGGAGGGGGGSGSGGGGGGGAGLYGGNNTGSGGSAGSGGGGGSGGCNGSSASGINGGRGGSYGGGAGGGYNYYNSGSNYSFGVGGNPPNNSNPHYGAIRIVWPGCVRKFPNTCVGNY